jgi:putative ABC transport system ATP-binding protein
VNDAGSLRVQGLSFCFAGQAQALLTVHALEVRAGHSLGISGVSGAGKTTLFHCLSGISRPTAGRVVWGGTDLCALKPDAVGRWRHRQLGLIFQDFHLVDGLSALDNVMLPAYFDSWRPAATVRERARELLAAVGITALDRMAAVLSRGERQRVAFARALLLCPAIVMADEPTASLDPDHRTQVGDLLVKLTGDHGATLIVISHEQELLMRMDRCLTLHAGHLQPRDDVNQVFVP